MDAQVHPINQIVALLKEHRTLIAQLQAGIGALKQMVVQLQSSNGDETQFSSADEYHRAVLDSPDEEAI